MDPPVHGGIARLAMLMKCEPLHHLVPDPSHHVGELLPPCRATRIKHPRRLRSSETQEFVSDVIVSCTWPRASEEIEMGRVFLETLSVHSAARRGRKGSLLAEQQEWLMQHSVGVKQDQVERAGTKETQSFSPSPFKSDMTNYISTYRTQCFPELWKKIRLCLLFVMIIRQISLYFNTS